jgi:hypothetical protein
MSAHDSALLDPTQPLEAFVYEPGCAVGVDFSTLDVGAIVHVHTTYSRYRLVVVSADEKRAMVTGGRLFPDSTEVRVEGATAGGSAIKPGWIGVGLRLELTTTTGRVTTSIVQAIAIDPPSTSMVC